MEIEELAVNAVTTALSKTDLLKPLINKNDKEPIWDGHIFAYSKSTKENDCLIGRAAVQVKGKKSNDIRSRNTKFDVSVNSLKHFRKEGGAVFFVVHINPKGTAKIYYKKLLPYNINNILYKKEHQKTVTIKFEAFPKVNKEIMETILNFLSDKEKQKSNRIGKNWTIEEVLDKWGSERTKLSFSVAGIDRKKFSYDYFFNHDLYFYAENKDLDLIIPISYAECADIIRKTIEAPVCVKDKVFYSSYDVCFQKSKTTLIIGKSFIIDSSSEHIKLKYDLKGNLSERIIAVDLLIHIIKNNTIILNGIELSFSLTEKEKENFNLEELGKQLSYFKEVKETLLLLDVTEELDCDSMNRKDMDNMNMLIGGIKYGKLQNFKSKDISPIIFIEISNLKILLQIIKDKSGNYVISCCNNKDLMFRGKDADDNEFPASFYTMFTRNDFCTISNINFDKMKQSISSFDNKNHLVQVNHTLLEMIEAYDINHDKNLIMAAIEIAKWLEEKGGTSTETLNLYQCYARIRSLSEEENCRLLKVIENTNEDYEILVGAHLLLGNQAMAIRYFEKLSREKKNSIENYPIYKKFALK